MKKLKSASLLPTGKWQQLPPQQHPVGAATAHPTGKWQQLPPQQQLVEAATAHPTTLHNNNYLAGEWQQLPPQQHPVEAATAHPNTAGWHARGWGGLLPPHQKNQQNGKKYKSKEKN